MAAFAGAVLVMVLSISTAVASTGVARGTAPPSGRYGPAVSTTPAPGPTIYVDAVAGDDAHDGLHPERALRSLAAVNARRLPDGASVLLRGGQVFEGGLVIEEPGGPGREPVVIGSFGGGRATIASGPRRGISVLDRAVVIRDLEVIGDPAGGTDGIVVHTDRPGDVLLAGVTVSRVEVHGYGRWGVALGSGTARSGYRDVLFEDLDLHGNGYGGLLTYAAAPDVHRNVRVLRTRAHDNPGVPGASGHTGNGIVLGGVSGGEVAHSSAYRNGGANDRDDEGPAGIWAYHSERVVIQFNEAYDNRTGSAADGDGFDLDLGTRDSVLQYNYSHGNDGAGFLLWQDGDVPSGGNVVRYNVSEGDGRRNGYGGLTIGGSSPGTMVHHNTIVGSGATPPVALFDAPSGHVLRNNLFLAGSAGPLVEALPWGATPEVAFRGNAYHSTGGRFEVRWAGRALTSLGAWRQAGQERDAGNDLGMFVDPRLAAQAPAGPPAGDGVGTAPRGSDAYRLGPGSPLIGSALPLLAAERGERDHFGGPVPVGDAADIGAHEAS